MNKMKLTLAAALMATTLPMLQGCVTAVVAGGAATVGVMSAHDRRLTGVQADDESAEWKGNNRIPAQLAEKSHVNFVSYNRRMLITGEVPTEEAKAIIGEIAAKIEGTATVYNELRVAPPSSFGERSKDAFITSKIKGRLVDTQQISANHIKVFTESGVSHLMGIVNDREAKLAVNVARTTDGVRKVVNVLEIIPESETRRIDNNLTGGTQKTVKQAPAPVENR